MTKIKICGITNNENALFAANAGAWALGFIFVKNSPRFIDPEKAAEIILYLPENIEKIGVFATRSGFRPNQIGLSAVRLLNITKGGSCIKLMIQGGDFLDQTPVLDIKPYLPYADVIPSATGGFATERPKSKMRIEFTPKALSTCIEKEKQGYPGLCELIIQTLSSDPRPAYYSQRPIRKKFGVKLYQFDIRWEIMDDHILVNEIENC